MKNRSSDILAEFQRSLEVMAKLRDPENGCPWDLAQNFATIAPHTIEEAYEVAEAIALEDYLGLKEELGDLFFQILFHCQMASESLYFDITDVMKALNDKMIERHPHVFGEGHIPNAEAQTEAWEVNKAKKRAAEAQARGQVPSTLDNMIQALPALTRAFKMQARAARIGFDWPEKSGAFLKLKEEIEELETARSSNNDNKNKAIEEELGDVLFSVVNVARHLEINPEIALQNATRKFERRFRRLEVILRASGIEPADASLETMELAWGQAKLEENN